MRILGLDVGQKTIGVALSDPLGFTAQGITTIRREKKSKDIEEIKKICDEYKVETIVIGLPKNMNNSIFSIYLTFYDKVHLGKTKIYGFYQIHFFLIV